MSTKKRTFEIDLNIIEDIKLISSKENITQNEVINRCVKLYTYRNYRNKKPVENLKKYKGGVITL